MKKDIPIQKVEDIIIAISPREDNFDDPESLWDVFILNLKDEPITCVLVNSTGYNDDSKTTTLRHFFETIGPLSVMLIEPIQAKLFELTNEYWVSFLHQDYMYDKKYIFVRGSINNSNFTEIPFLGRKGVMIR